MNTGNTIYVFMHVFFRLYSKNNKFLVVLGCCPQHNFGTLFYKVQEHTGKVGEGPVAFRDLIGQPSVSN